MPEIIETTVYRLHELSDAAKDKACAWYREASGDDDWHEFVFEDFEAICTILGVRLKTRPLRLHGGGTRQKPCIWFRGFWSQGDGACYEAFYSYQKVAPRQIRGHAPKDYELHRIAEALQAIQQRNFFQLNAEASHHGHYYHEHCMSISVERDSPTYQDKTTDAEETVTELLRDLARWLYRQLEREYEHHLSDAVVDEMLTINGHTFTKSGDRFE